MKVFSNKKLQKIVSYFIECNSRKNLLNKLIILVIIIFLEMLIVFLLRNRFLPYLVPGSEFKIIENSGFINIVVFSNSGIGFSTLSDHTAAVYAIQSIVMILVFIWFLFSKNIDFLITLAMIFSGALANILDRATSGNDTVLDYFQFWFGGAIFNFADSTIVCGFIALFISYLVRIILQIISDRKIKENLNDEKLKTPYINESEEINNMMYSNSFIVEEKEKRLDLFLAKLLMLSRTKISFLILNGFVSVNNEICKKNNFPLKPKDKVDVNYDEDFFLKPKKEILPYKMDLDILYEDDYLIVCNKPKGIITHPTIHNEKNTLVNGLLYHTKNKSKIFMVHRLDRDTSGLIIAAKDFKILNLMQDQLRSKEIKRFYLALVNFPFNELMGTIDAPIGHVGNENLKFGVINAKNPKKSITKFYVLDQNSRYALLKCELLTGRTHQIRVHMEFIEHWIVNDPLYGIKGEIRTNYKQFLHAYQLEFKHPINNKKIFLQCDLDETFKNKLKSLNLKIDKSLEKLVNEKI